MNHKNVQQVSIYCIQISLLNLSCCQCIVEQQYSHFQLSFKNQYNGDQLCRVFPLSPIDYSIELTINRDIRERVYSCVIDGATDAETTLFTYIVRSLGKLTSFSFSYLSFIFFVFPYIYIFIYMSIVLQGILVKAIKTS